MNASVYELEYTEYGSTGTYAFWDRESDTYYNDFGQRLRDPNEYDRYSEGYTPFGDE